MERFVWTLVAQLAKQWLIGGVTPAQSVEVDALMREINLAAYQSMGPMLIDAEGFVEQRHVAVLVASAHEDHRAGERSAEIELELCGKATPVGGGFSPGGGLGAISRDRTRADGCQACVIGEVIRSQPLLFRRL